jgi:hypothetical protein
MSESWMDGNSMAGPLHEVLGVDVTEATGRCAGCKSTGPLAEGRVYGPAPGLVLRCRSCGLPLLRLARTPGRTRLDLRGLEYLEFTWSV